MTGQRQVIGQGPVRVLIVDDSPTIRAILRSVISADPRLAVAGEARDPYEARDLIKALAPDVLTLDIEMPRMDGLAFLDRLRRLRPMPVVVISSRARDRSAEAVRAMALGAVDCVDVSRFQQDPDVRRRLIDTLVLAGGANVQPQRPVPPEMPACGQGGTPYPWNGAIVFIGSSTGGVDALERVLARFPIGCPPTVVAQHMPPAFLESFARRLDASLSPQVAVALDGERLRPGRILLAGGGTHHLTVARGAPPMTRLVPARTGDVYVPTIDKLFNSATTLRGRAVGCILTGMGRDGAEGLLAMRQAGAATLAQSPETCVIDGMPRAAREIGAAGQVMPLDRIGARLLDLCRKEGAEACPSREPT